VELLPPRSQITRGAAQRGHLDEIDVPRYDRELSSRRVIPQFLIRRAIEPDQPRSGGGREQVRQHARKAMAEILVEQEFHGWAA